MHLWHMLGIVSLVVNTVFFFTFFIGAAEDAVGFGAIGIFIMPPLFLPIIIAPFELAVRFKRFNMESSILHVILAIYFGLQFFLYLSIVGRVVARGETLQDSLEGLFMMILNALSIVAILSFTPFFRSKKALAADTHDAPREGTKR